MPAETLNFWLAKFVMEVCKEDGECYPPQTLYSICCGIQRHLAEINGVNAFTILDKKDNRFATFRWALDGETRQANYEGVTRSTLEVLMRLKFYIKNTNEVKTHSAPLSPRTEIKYRPQAFNIEDISLVLKVNACD
ncbi:Hypothetical predicted protein [Paramuricea clavata]|uniref:QRICH1-like domain-containing protein n=1 Tax=Paramuricea clavata TaxID=317549 RepID=A0A6S7GDF7_PARCT|nr:Hypothetical predicted protein [Paramuricea clavata]